MAIFFDILIVCVSLSEVNNVGDIFYCSTFYRIIVNYLAISNKIRIFVYSYISLIYVFSLCHR